MQRLEQDFFPESACVLGREMGKEDFNKSP